jgi:hypothetical protein
VSGGAVVIYSGPQLEMGCAVTPALDFRTDASSSGQVHVANVWPVAESNFFEGVCG